MWSSIQRRAGVFLAATAFVLAGAVAPADAYDFRTTIDLNYTYEQEHREGNVNARTGFQQKYQIGLDTTLTSSLDFHGAISVDLDNSWRTGAATTSRVSPSLDLGVAGPQSSALFSYSGGKSHTDQFRETAESTQYSNAYDLDLELTPTYWPELKFRLSEKRDYEEARNDSAGRTIELQLRDWIYDLQWEFTLKLTKDTATLPENTESDSTDWSWRATYRNTLYGDVDFEAAYEIKESYSEGKMRDVFTSNSEDYTQTLKTRLEKSLDLTPRLNVDVSWEYQYEEDLLEQGFDYRLNNRYALGMSYDVTTSLKVTADARRETVLEQAVPGQDDTSTSSDTLAGAFDFEPTTWLRLGGRAEKRWEQSVQDGTGGSVDHTDDEKYELLARNDIGKFWALTLGANWSSSHTEGVLQNQEAKFKADLNLTLLDLDWLDMNLLPSYESSRTESWDELGDPTGDTWTSDLNIRFGAKATLFQDLLQLTFTHEYGQKITHETDEVLNYTRELGYNEGTRLNVAINDLIDNLDLEGEIERKADDTEDDAEPQVVEISYSLRLDWSYEELTLASAFKYTDKGQDPDSADFTVQVGWSGDNFDISGDYQFTKNYSDLTDESRKLNLRLSYNF